MLALLEQTTVESEAYPWAGGASLNAPGASDRYNPRNAKLIGLLVTLCTAFILVGVVWRAWQLDQVPGVNGDEAWYGVQSQRFLDEYIYGKTLPEIERVNFRTPTGNLWNPFLMIPRIMLDATFAPSVYSLRLPAVISGILTLLVNWWLCRRAFGRTMAWLTTTLLSVLPVTMIYSRLGWDTCQSVLFCLPLVYLPWIASRQKMSGLRTGIYFVLATAAALVVHPTNVFLVSLSVILFWPRIRAAAKWELSLQSRLLLSVAAVSSAILIGISRGAWSGVRFENAISALAQWAGDVVGLFSGATVYGSISLPAEQFPTAQRWLLLLSFPTIGILFWSRIACKTALFSPLIETMKQRYAALFDGICLSLLCFLGVAGPAAIQPGYERYGLWVIAPGALLIVMAYSLLSVRSRQILVGVMVVSILQIALLLAGYWQYYQRRFDVPAVEQRLAHWTYQADNFANWPEMRAEFEKSLATPHEITRKLILVLENDPQRWWFEWKWRYLSHGSEYEWQVIRTAQEAHTTKNSGTQRWILQSHKEFEKENLAIQYLAD